VKIRPILVCTPNPCLRFLQPHLLNAFAVIQIEFAFDDPPSLGIDVSGVVFTYGVSTVTAVLRSVLFRGFCEEVPVLSRSKLPNNIAPCKAEFHVPLDRFGAGEISDGVVSLNGDATAIVIDGI